MNVVICKMALHLLIVHKQYVVTVNKCYGYCLFRVKWLNALERLCNATASSLKLCQNLLLAVNSKQKRRLRNVWCIKWAIFAIIFQLCFSLTLVRSIFQAVFSQHLRVGAVMLWVKRDLQWPQSTWHLLSVLSLYRPLFRPAPCVQVPPSRTTVGEDWTVGSVTATTAWIWFKYNKYAKKRRKLPDFLTN